MRTQSGYHGYTTISASQLDNETMPYKHTHLHTHTAAHTKMLRTNTTLTSFTPFLMKKYLVPRGMADRQTHKI